MISDNFRAIGLSKEVIVELNELFGKRNLRLKISGRIINNIN